jgi:predicted CoA-binding protein
MDEQARARRALETSRTIAVLGIHDDLSRPAAYVPEYLAAVGYRVLGVNPMLVGRSVLGHPVVATLAELTELTELTELSGPIDMVDVFRRPAAIPSHLDDILAAKPKLVWFQLGIRNDAAAEILESHGIEVIQDRCTYADHRRFGLPRG